MSGFLVWFDRNSSKGQRINLCLVFVSLMLSMQALLLSPGIYAAKPSGITVTPVRSRPTLQPGSTSAGSLKITNNTATVQKLNLSAEHFGVTNENYDYSFTEVGSENWISFTDNSITLQPNQSKELAYKLAVPASASPGGHYFSLMVATQGSNNSTRINEIYRIASMIYLEVSGKIVYKSSLLSLDVPWLTTDKNIPFSVRLANNGNTHEDTRVSVKTETLGINRLGTEKILPNLTLPNTIRNIDSKTQLGWLPGLYKFTATYAPKQGGQDIKSQTVVYLPLWSIIFLLFALGTVAWRVVRYYRN